MSADKKGFTLGEVLVCIVIIGVIMALSMQTIKMVRTSYTSLAYFAFNTVQDMVGTIYAGDSPSERLTDTDGKNIGSTVIFCGGSTGMINMVLKPDKEPAGFVQCNQLNSSSSYATNTFCNALVSISNTAGKTDCKELSSNLYSDDKKEPYIVLKDYDKPNFIATNGMRYYISEWDFNENVSKVFGYRLVAVDLNSTTGPNLTDYNAGNRLPDIVTFMVMDNGEVLPLGAAADNKSVGGNRTVRYINSKVKGYYYGYDKDRKTGIPQECFLKTKDGVVQSCNYAVVYVQNDTTATPEEDEEEENKPENEKKMKKTTIFTYRQAYCGINPNAENTLTHYCENAESIDLCPPSSSDKKFDLCTIENIKPMFRYNFK